MATETDKVPAPPSRWIRLVLVLSLTVNLLLVGLAVGAAYNFKASGGPPRSFDLSIGVLGGALDLEARRELGRSMNRGTGERPPRRGDRARMMANLADALRATPFDADALAGVMQDQRQQWIGVQVSAQAALIDYVSGLSAEERAGLADRIEQQSAQRHSEGRRD